MGVLPLDQLGRLALSRVSVLTDPKTRTAVVCGALVRELEIGLVDEGGLHNSYRGLLLELRKALGGMINYLLWNYASSRKSGGPDDVTQLDLKRAALSVFEGLKGVANQAVLVELETALKNGSEVTPVDETLPTPHAVYQAFHNFSSELQKELNDQVVRLHGRRIGNKLGTATIDRSPHLLKAAVREWILEKGLPAVTPFVKRFQAQMVAVPDARELETLGRFAEIFTWLATTPVEHIHELLFSTWRRGRDFKGSKEGMGLFQTLVEMIVRHLKKPLVLDTVKLPASRYRVLLTKSDPALEEGFKKVVPDARLRERLIEASGSPMDLLLSHTDRFREGLAEAVVALNPMDRVDLRFSEYCEHLRALVAVMELLMSSLLTQGFFFEYQVTGRGLDYFSQQVLLETINRVFSTSYYFAGKGPYRLFREGLLSQGLLEEGYLPSVTAADPRLWRRQDQRGLILRQLTEIQTMAKSGASNPAVRNYCATNVSDWGFPLRDLARLHPEIRVAVRNLVHYATSRKRVPNQPLAAVRSCLSPVLEVLRMDPVGLPPLEPFQEQVIVVGDWLARSSGVRVGQVTAITVRPEREYLYEVRYPKGGTTVVSASRLKTMRLVVVCSEPPKSPTG